MNPPFDGEMAPNRRSDRIKSLGGLAPSYVEPTIEYSDDQSSYSEEENDSPEASEPGYVSKKRRRKFYAPRCLSDDTYQPESGTWSVAQSSALRKDLLMPTRLVTSGHKRRRLVSDGDGDDDDEGEEQVKPAGLFNTDAEVIRAASGLNHDKIPERQTTADRMVKLVVRVFGGNPILIIVEQSAISRIATLTAQLSVPLSDPDQRQTVNCSTLSEEETVIQAIEYLETGKLQSLTKGPESSLSLRDQLCMRIELFDISQELNIPDLATAIIEQIEKCPLLNPEILAQFGKDCYDRAAKHRIEKESSLGRLVQAKLEKFLPEMMASGLADMIREIVDLCQSNWTRCRGSDTRSWSDIGSLAW